SYLGQLAWTGNHQLRAVSLGIITLGVLLVRSRIVWSGLSLEKFYLPPKSW
ncbi:MAG: sulfite exporter TauE/SafE family protein, partial [Moorea sp. SIO4G2]|nr:sulfite exporter TauE/SafE family protein [Moorena sp. SIO4G2]